MVSPGGQGISGIKPLAPLRILSTSSRTSHLLGRAFCSLLVHLPQLLAGERNTGRYECPRNSNGCLQGRIPPRMQPRNLFSTTPDAYQNHLEAFENLCKMDGNTPLPPTYSPVSGYLGYILDKGTMFGGSLRPYIGAVGNQHLRSGMKDPTKHPQVVATRQGYIAIDAAMTAGPPLQSSTLPSACA